MTSRGELNSSSAPDLWLERLQHAKAWATGARLTRAGFGGNTINVVEASRAEACAREIAARYGRGTSVRVVRAAEGVRGSGG